MHFQYKNQDYQFNRYPSSSNNSLKPWSSADEHLLQYLDTLPAPHHIALYNDRFGFLTCLLNSSKPHTILSHKSQEKAVRLNLESNQLSCEESNFHHPLEQLTLSWDIVLLKIPKSLELFQLYLYQLTATLHENSEVVCAFMTRNFSPQFLELAKLFFDDVTQSKAWKKSRLLHLKKPKKRPELDLLLHIPFEGRLFQQYYGVFSSKHIDYATQFFIQHLNAASEDKKVLDLASGNGILAATIQDQNPDIVLHLLDDSFLAIESSKLNLNPLNCSFHYNDNLEIFEDNYFDLVISNPPFHFEYEINIEISQWLFKQTARCLKPKGHFKMVANKHLNYRSHLEKIFQEVTVIAENTKFIIYDCIK